MESVGKNPHPQDNDSSADGFTSTSPVSSLSAGLAEQKQTQKQVPRRDGVVVEGLHQTLPPLTPTHTTIASATQPLTQQQQQQQQQHHQNLHHQDELRPPSPFARARSLSGSILTRSSQDEPPPLRSLPIPDIPTPLLAASPMKTSYNVSPQLILSSMSSASALSSASSSFSSSLLSKKSSHQTLDVITESSASSSTTRSSRSHSLSHHSHHSTSTSHYSTSNFSQTQTLSVKPGHEQSVHQNDSDNDAIFGDLDDISHHHRSLDHKSEVTRTDKKSTSTNREESKSSELENVINRNDASPHRIQLPGLKVYNSMEELIKTEKHLLMPLFHDDGASFSKNEKISSEFQTPPSREFQTAQFSNPSDSSYHPDVHRPTALQNQLARQEFIVESKGRKWKQGRLLLVSLLENFCMLYDQSPERNRRLFFLLCKQLSAMGIIDSDDFLDEISAVRGSYKRAFRDLVVDAMHAIREEQYLSRSIPASTSHSRAASSASSEKDLMWGLGQNRGMDLHDFGAATYEDSDSSSNSIILMKRPLTSTHIGLGFHRPSLSYDPLSLIRPQVLDTTQPPPTSRIVHHHHQPNPVRDISEILDVGQSRYRDDFEQGKLLGKGGFGSVWAVKNRLDGVEYAVKCVRLRDRGGKRESLERILREVKVQARLTHPNVVRYFGCWFEHVVTSTASNMNSDDYYYDYEDESESKFSPRIRSANTSSNSQSNREALSASSHPFSEVSFTGMAQPNRRFTFEESSISSENDDFVEFAASSSENNYSQASASLGENRDSVNDYKKNNAIVKRSSQPDYNSSLLYRELTLFIQMELCGHTLQHFLTVRNQHIGSSASQESLYQINPSNSLSIFRDICEGLAYIHSQSCIHRDIAPKNIFWVPGSINSSSSQKINSISSKSESTLSSETSIISELSPLLLNNTPVTPPTMSEFGGIGCWKIGDYGLVTLADNSNEDISRLRTDELKGDAHVSTSTKKSHGQRTTRVGTVTYAPPEQISPTPGIPYTSKCDMFAAGIVLFELFYPFRTGMERIETLQGLRNGVLPFEFVAKWPKEATLVLWLISEDPAQRPSARDVLDHEFLKLMQELNQTQSDEDAISKSNMKSSFSLPNLIHQESSNKSNHHSLKEVDTDGLLPKFAVMKLQDAEERALKAESELAIARLEIKKLKGRVEELEKLYIK